MPALGISIHSILPPSLKDLFRFKCCASGVQGRNRALVFSPCKHHSYSPNSGSYFCLCNCRGSSFVSHLPTARTGAIGTFPPPSPSHLPSGSPFSLLFILVAVFPPPSLQEAPHSVSMNRRQGCQEPSHNGPARASGRLTHTSAAGRGASGGTRPEGGFHPTPSGPAAAPGHSHGAFLAGTAPAC